jgi:hypothetical protein
VSLTAAGNAVARASFTTESGDLQFHNSRDLEIASIIAGDGDVDLYVAGAVVENAGSAISADRLLVSTGAPAASILLSGVRNDVRRLQLSTQGASASFDNSRSLEDLGLHTQGGAATISVRGGVQQQVLGPIEVGLLTVRDRGGSADGGGIDLRNPRNAASQIDLIAARGNVAWFSTVGFEVIQAQGTGVVSLRSDGSVSQAPGGRLQGSSLVLRGSGQFDLNWTGEALRLAADLSPAGSRLDLLAAVPITMTPVDGVEDFRAGQVVLRETLLVTQAGSDLDVGHLTLICDGRGGNYDLSSAENQVAQLTAILPGGNLILNDNGDLALDGLRLASGRLVTQAEVRQITGSELHVAGRLEVVARGDSAGINLRETGNHAGEIDFRAGTGGVAWHSHEGFAISRLSTTGMISLLTNDVVRQLRPGAVEGRSLALRGTGSFELFVTASARLDVASQLDRNHSLLKLASDQPLQVTALDGIAGLRAQEVELHVVSQAGASLLSSDSAIAQAVSIPGNQIETTHLRLWAEIPGSIRLSGVGNLVETLQASVAGGDMDFSNAIPLEIAGIAAGPVGTPGQVELTVRGGVTQGAPLSSGIVAQRLTVQTTAPDGKITLINPANQISEAKLATQNSDVSFQTSGPLGDLSVRAPGATASIAAVGTVAQVDPGLGPIVARHLVVTSGQRSLPTNTPAVRLNANANDIELLSVQAPSGGLEWSDLSGFTIDSLDVPGDVWLIAGGAVSQVRALGLASLSLGGPGEFRLTDPGNLVQILSAGETRFSSRPQVLEFHTGGNLTIGATPHAQGLSVAKALDLQVGGTLTVTHDVRVGQQARVTVAQQSSFETSLPDQDPVGEPARIIVERDAIVTSGLRPYVTVDPKMVAPDVEINLLGQVTLSLTIGREGEQGLEALIDWGDGTVDELSQARDYRPGIPFSRTHLYSPEAIQAQMQNSTVGTPSGFNEFAIQIMARYRTGALEFTRDAAPGEAQVENTTVPRDNSGQSTQFFTSVQTAEGRTDLTQNVLTVVVSSPGFNPPGLAVREFGSPGPVALPPRTISETDPAPTQAFINEATFEVVRADLYLNQAERRSVLLVQRIIDGLDEAEEPEPWFIFRKSKPDQVAGENAWSAVKIESRLDLPDADQPATRQEILEWLRTQPDGHYQILRFEVGNGELLNPVVLEDLFLSGGAEISPELLQPPDLPTPVRPSAPPATPREGELRDADSGGAEPAPTATQVPAPGWQPAPALLAQQALSRVRHERVSPASPVPPSPSDHSAGTGELPGPRPATPVPLLPGDAP